MDMLGDSGVNAMCDPQHAACEELYRRLRGLVLSYEDFVTCGGTSVREMEAFTI